MAGGGGKLDFFLSAVREFVFLEVDYEIALSLCGLGISEGDRGRPLLMVHTLAYPVVTAFFIRRCMKHYLLIACRVSCVHNTRVVPLNPRIIHLA